MSIQIHLCLFNIVSLKKFNLQKIKQVIGKFLDRNFVSKIRETF